jgi:hypothetical protein
VLINANSSSHKHGQGVHHSDLRSLLFDLGDMHRPSPNMEEDMEFAKGIIINQVLKKFAKSRNLITFSCD